MRNNNPYELLVNVVKSFTHVGFVNGLSDEQYKALGKALAFIQKRERMRNKKEDHPIMAHALKNEGYTIREIASILGYKHPGSVTHLLSKANQ